MSGTNLYSVQIGMDGLSGEVTELALHLNFLSNFEITYPIHYPLWSGSQWLFLFSNPALQRALPQSLSFWHMPYFLSLSLKWPQLRRANISCKGHISILHASCLPVLKMHGIENIHGYVVASTMLDSILHEQPWQKFRNWEKSNYYYTQHTALILHLQITICFDGPFLTWSPPLWARR